MSLRVRELTPRGSGAVSVLAITGNGALEAVRALSGVAAIPIGVPSLLKLRAGGEALDETIVCASSPSEVELHLHGSPPLVRRMIDLLGRDPRPAARAAATDVQAGAAQGIRAQAESVEDLARVLLATAPCEAGARILLDQSEGALSHELRSLASMGEPEVGRAIDSLLARWRIARPALRPSVVVIAGRANAGKSTLFNALVGERRAIVDARPGTTRDLLRAHALLGAWPVILVDTAGDRDLDRSREEPPAQASVERRGQELARAARDVADLVLWLEPLDPYGSVPAHAPPQAGARAILVPTFADRVDPSSRPAHAVSALAEPALARERVAAAFRAQLGLPLDPWRARAAVPISEGLVRGIEELARLPAGELGPAIERLLRGPHARPRMRAGCGWEDDPVPCPPGIA